MAAQRHILLADGCGAFRHMVGEILKGAGLSNVTDVGSYKEALSVLRAYKVDLLIIAAEIDGSSGLDQINLIRAGKAGCKKALPVIVLASPSDSNDVAHGLHERAMSAGASACMFAPLSMKALIPVVFSALGERIETKKHSGKMLFARPGFSRFLMKKLNVMGRMLVSVPQEG